MEMRNRLLNSFCTSYKQGIVLPPAKHRVVLGEKVQESCIVWTKKYSIGYGIINKGGREILG